MTEHSATRGMTLASAREGLRSTSYRVRSRIIERLRGRSSLRIARLLIPLTKDPHYQVRYLAAEALGYFPKSDELISALVDALGDHDEVVRLNSAISLGRVRAAAALPHLVGALCLDDDPLVRSYAAMAIGDIGEKTLVHVLTSAHQRDDSATARLGMEKALYDLGERSWLRRFMKNLDSPDYRNRCACANLVAEMVDEGNVNYVERRLRRSLLTEETVAAKSSIQRALDVIRERFAERAETASTRRN